MSNNHRNKLQSRRLLAEVTVREATAADERGLALLAELDSTRAPAGPALVAEVGGELRAAVSMLDGRAIADPFHPTAELVAMLRMRAGLAVAPSGAAIRGVGRSRWGESPRPQGPAPGAPSVPGIPVVPHRAF